MKIIYEVGDKVYINKGKGYEKIGIILSITPMKKKVIVLGNDGRRYSTLITSLLPCFK